MTSSAGAIVQKESETILFEILDVHKRVENCPLCAKPFGEPLANGQRRKVLSACAFQKGARVAEDRRKSCVVCPECVENADEEGEEGAGHIYNKAGKCKICVVVKKLNPRDACYATCPPTELVEMTDMFAALYDGAADNVTRLSDVDAQLQTEAGEGQRAAAAAAKDAAAQKRGFRDRAHELQHREDAMAVARSHPIMPFAGSDWDDYVTWQSAIAEAAKEEERKAAEAANKQELDAAAAALEQERKAAAKALEKERKSAKRKADEEAAAALEEAKKERDAAVRAAEKKAKDERDEAIRQALANARKAPTAAATSSTAATAASSTTVAAEVASAPAPASKPRTQASKDAAKAKKATSKNLLDSTHTQLVNMATAMNFKAPAGMTTGTKKAPDVGDLRLDGKYTKDTFFEHMPAFLKRANTQIGKLEAEHDDAVVRGNVLATALRGVIKNQYTGSTLAEEDEATVDAAVDARLTKLGIMDLMAPLAKRLEDDAEGEEEGEEEEEMMEEEAEAAITGGWAGFMAKDDEEEDGELCD